LNEIEAFEAKLDARYSKWWIGSGKQQKTKVTKILNDLNSTRSQFVAGKAQRWAGLGFSAIAGIELFDLFAKNAQAANNIANHNPAQLQKWNDLVLQYDASLDQVVDLDRLTKSRGLFLKKAFIEYWTELGLDAAAVTAADLALTKWIEFNLYD
jgi:hypothetical protein